MHGRLKHEIKKSIEKYPRLLDTRLHAGLERLSANSPDDFLRSRTFKHLKTLLAVQFFTQKKMEQALEEENREQDLLFVKLFQINSRICCAVSFHSSYNFNQEQLLAIFHTLLPGIQTVLNSSYMWFHPVLSYQFCYIEVEKMRGQGLSTKELRLLEKSIREQLLALSPLTPTIFWPYNAEESYRQVQFLQREMQSPTELAHISILFLEQTLNSLEFLIHYARPKDSNPLEEALKRLPHSFDFFFRFKKFVSQPFPIEIGAFSLKVPSSVFDVRGSINLLYARRYIAKYLEMVCGPFRDYNGGLFEKQQYHFEILRVNLSDKIPLFDLFAEKVFYALHPIEARLSLSLKDAENLFLAFSEILQTKESYALVRRGESVIVVKNGHSTDTLSSVYREAAEGTTAHAHLNLGTAGYFCCLGPHVGAQIPALLTQKTSEQKKMRPLRLSFQEGAPPSLNPHLSSGDMRCRMLGKLLFEGLMRLNAQGEPEPAGAIEYYASEDGLRYTFKLRPCFWSNGEKVTAIDYVTSWQRALRDGVSHPEQLFVIKNGRLFKEFMCDGKKLGVRAEDSKTLEIELEHPDLYFLHKLAQPFFFPVFGSMREPKWFNGPYIIRHQTREGLLLERNPYFWKTHLPFLEQIEIKWLGDMETIFRMFQEGQNDWVGDPLSTLSLGHVQLLQDQKRLHTRKVNRRFLVHFNTKLLHLSHPNIRHALSLAIERSLVCDKIFPFSVPLFHLALPRENVQELFALGLKEMHLSKESFPPLTFSYSHQTGREALAQYLQSTWEQQFGISVRLERIEWNSFRHKLEKGEFEIAGTIQETLENAPLEFLDRFEGSSSWNFSQWQHPGYRTFLKQACSATETGQQLELQNKAEALLCAEAPFTPLSRCSHLFAHHQGLQNYFFDQEGCVDFSQAYFTE
ncbi:peptide ABC transporter substrate-binding protein [Chlamydiota bacterium]